MSSTVRTRPIGGAVCGVAVVLMSVVAGCDDVGSSELTDPASKAATTGRALSSSQSTSPADAARQQAIATYVGMWDEYAIAAMTSDWQAPALGKFATGAALSTMSRGLYADHYNGLVSRGHPVNKPVVSSAVPADIPSRVGVSDCGDSTNWTKVRADNEQPAGGPPGGRRQINAVVEKQVDGSWKVSDFGVQEVGSC